MPGGEGAFERLKGATIAWWEENVEKYLYAASFRERCGKKNVRSVDRVIYLDSANKY